MRRVSPGTPKGLGSSSTDQFTNFVSTFLSSATERMSEIFLYKSLHNFSPVVSTCRSDSTEQQPGGLSQSVPVFSD